MLEKIKKELKEGKTFLQFGFLKALGQGLTMVMPLVIAKFLSEELYASYNLAKMVVFFFSMLFVASLQAPFIVFANQERDKRGRINKTFSAQCFFLLIGFVVFLTISFFFAGPISSLARISKADIPFLVFAYIGISLKTFVCNLFMGMGQRVRHSIAEFIFGLTCIILVFIFFFAGNINIQTVFMVYPISAAILILIFVWFINFSHLFPFSLDLEYLLKILNFTKWQFLGATAVYFVNWGSKLVLRYYGSSFNDIGVFSLGFDLFKGLVTLVATIGMYFLPFVSTNIDKVAKMSDYLGRKRKRIVVLGTLVVVLLIIITPYVIRFVYKQSYVGSDIVIRMLLLAIVFEMYTIFYRPLFDVLKMYRLYQTINIIHVVANLILNFSLVPFFGYQGAAAACLLGYILRAVLLEINFRRTLKPQLGL